LICRLASQACQSAAELSRFPVEYFPEFAATTGCGADGRRVTALVVDPSATEFGGGKMALVVEYVATMNQAVTMAAALQLRRRNHNQCLIVSRNEQCRPRVRHPVISAEPPLMLTLTVALMDYPVSL